MAQCKTVVTILLTHRSYLTHWGRVTHICVGNLTTIGSDNGLPPGRRQAIIWTKCWNIVNWTPRNIYQWNFNRNSYNFIQENAFENVVCEMASICLGLNLLTHVNTILHQAVDIIIEFIHVYQRLPIYSIWCVLQKTPLDNIPNTFKTLIDVPCVDKSVSWQ